MTLEEPPSGQSLSHSDARACRAPQTPSSPPSEPGPAAGSILVHSLFAGTGGSSSGAGLNVSRDLPQPLLGHHHPPLGGDLSCHLRVPASPPLGMKPGTLCSRPGQTKLDKNRERRPGNHITARPPHQPFCLLLLLYFIKRSGSSSAATLLGHGQSSRQRRSTPGSGPRVSLQGTSSSSWLPG